MTSENTEAQPPGKGSGLADEEPAGGRVVESSVQRYPVAFASAFAPAGRRSMWAYTLRCPHCGAGHFGRARSQDGVRGLRRTGCGRRVVVVVARTYPAEVAR